MESKQVVKRFSKAEEQFILIYDLNPHDTDYVDECLHLPNNIDFQAEIQTDEEIIRQYECHQCGKTVQNVYRYSETRE